MISPFSCKGPLPVTALGGRLPCLHDIVERRTGIRQIVQEIFLLPRFRTPLWAWSPQYLVISISASASDGSFFISTAESALAGIAALAPVGSAPELSHRRTEPQLSCRACGTYLHGRNAPGNNLPIRHVPTPRRYA